MGKLLLDEILARLDALETAAFGHPRRRLSKKALAAQRGCSTRQVMRDVERKVLPPPDEVVNNRLFWWSDSVERHSKRGPADTPEAKALRAPRLRRPAPTAEPR